MQKVIIGKAARNAEGSPLKAAENNAPKYTAKKTPQARKDTSCNTIALPQLPFNEDKAMSFNSLGCFIIKNKLKVNCYKNFCENNVFLNNEQDLNIKKC